MSSHLLRWIARPGLNEFGVCPWRVVSRRGEEELPKETDTSLSSRAAAAAAAFHRPSIHYILIITITHSNSAHSALDCLPTYRPSRRDEVDLDEKKGRSLGFIWACRALTTTTLNSHLCWSKANKLQQVGNNLHFCLISHNCKGQTHMQATWRKVKYRKGEKIDGNKREQGKQKIYVGDPRLPDPSSSCRWCATYQSIKGQLSSFLPDQSSSNPPIN